LTDYRPPVLQTGGATTELFILLYGLALDYYGEARLSGTRVKVETPGFKQMKIDEEEL